MSESRPSSHRVLALDIGGKRTGLAISDASGTLARPLAVVSGADIVGGIIAWIDRCAGEDEGLRAIVVGRPTRLDGTPNEQTARVEQTVVALARRTTVPIFWQDERLTSVEAESRLATLEKDWRKRKAKLDAAAAAIILQDFLDAQPAPHIS
jgi:putative Holliday junction resolvase